MTMWIYLLLAAALLGALTAALARVVRQDGFGHRPPPASHHDWFGPRP